MFIGVTGTNCSGKGEVVRLLKEKRVYNIHSLSDILRDEARTRGIEPTVDNLVNLGNELREKHGDDILAIRTIEQILGDVRPAHLDEAGDDIEKYVKLKCKVTAGAIIDSIRNPAEVNAFKNNLQHELIRRYIHRVFYLVAVDAPIEIRYQRLLERKRINGEKDMPYDDFVKKDARSLGLDQPGSGQQMGKVIKMANHSINNDSDKNDLSEKVNIALKAAKQYKVDSSYMQFALLASSRSDCLTRSTGAIYVKEDQILTTGFNGSPRGIKNCNEGGCKRCNDPKIERGKDLDKCICSHAEANGADQAARIGTSLKGSTIYALTFPCSYCTKQIIQVGVERLVYNGEYSGMEGSLELFKQAGVRVDKVDLTL